MKYFKLSEFACKCCGQIKMQLAQLEMLDRARSLADIAFHVTSGYRCEQHNRECGGVSGSSHTLGYATDITCTDSDHRWKILQACIAVGYTRIGIYKRFIHVDCDPNKPSHVVWLGRDLI